MGDKRDLCMAPNRQKRPLNGRELHRERRVVHMVWDVDSETTAAMMADVGVREMSDDDMDCGYTGRTYGRSKPTPVAGRKSEYIAPGAPVIAAPCPRLGSSLKDGEIEVRDPYVFGDSKESPFVAKTLRSQGIAEGYDYINCLLSEEIVLCIFKWLPKSTLARCAMVCRRWYSMALDESLWRRVDLGHRQLKPGVLGHVLDQGATILRLTGAEIKMPLYEMSSDSVYQHRLVQLQYLDLSIATLDTGGLEDFLSRCHLLRKLSLESCRCPLNDTICRYIGQNKNLEVLNLALTCGITENCLVPICNGLKKLDSLNISWTELSCGAIVYLVTCLPPSLTKLNLSGCRETLVDEDVQQLCGSCPHMKELDLSDCMKLTGNAVMHIITALADSLEYMGLSRCYRIVPDYLTMFRSVSTLLALDVFGMLKDPTIEQLREVLPNVLINRHLFSSIARPTTGIRRTSIWGLRVRDSVP